MPSRTTTLLPKQLRCLESPVRLALFAALRAGGAASVKELAARLGKRPDALYYHVRALQRAGLVLERARRPAGTRVEAVYAMAARAYVVPPLAGDKRVRDSALRAARNAVRLAERRLLAAARRLPQDPALEERLDFHFINARLPPARLRRLRTDLQRLVLEALGDGGEQGDPVMLVALLVPGR